MTNFLRATLISDGSSDRALLPVLKWLVLAEGWDGVVEIAWADLRGLPNPPKDLGTRIATAARLFPCELLFVHRDAEREPFAGRKREIELAVRALDLPRESVPVCVVPVRMQEAWLLFDEPALRRAAGRPAGRRPLNLPRVPEVETLPDPKGMLHDLLLDASETVGRRRKRFDIQGSVHRLASLIDDFSPLRELPAFRCLAVDLREILLSRPWEVRSSHGSG